ncbi:hypothetical protein BDY19DRAFT_997254 [Irpex rosettiformis]|uniref:Uncharacterized protein n=1 Tax=Irpex rosettiformis TaxID=378272 RepID=A0ACB8TS71_9APHY|nr:hypothetical protein BDY19DRAFT_997254 [Irpex rosettiformis]
MNYLKLAPLFVYLLTVSVSARPLDEGAPIGDMTLGLVLPTAIPNLKLPLPDAGTGSSAKPSVPGVPGAPIPGAGASKSSNAPGLSSLSHVAKPAKALRRSPGPGPGPSHSNPRLQPRMVREPDYAAAKSNVTIPVAPTTTEASTKREINEKQFRKGWVVPPPQPSSTPSSQQAHPKRAPKHSKKKGYITQNHKRPTQAAAQKPTHTEPAKSDQAAPARPDLKAEHAAEDSASASSSKPSNNSPAAGFANLVKSTGAAPSLLQAAAAGVPALPDTPVTSADTNPTIDAAADQGNEQAKAQAKVPQPVQEKTPETGDNKSAYPAYSGNLPAAPTPASSTPTATTKVRRHSLVLDSDPAIPPSADTKAKKDPAFGLVNFDSNAKPPPSSADSAGKVSKPSAKPSSTPVPVPKESIYQPEEPGYGSASVYPEATMSPSP